MSFRTQDTSSHLFLLTLLQREASVAPPRVLCQGGDWLCSASALPARCQVLSAFLPSAPLLPLSRGRVDRAFPLLSGYLPISAQPFDVDPLTGLRLCERGFV